MNTNLMNQNVPMAPNNLYRFNPNSDINNMIQSNLGTPNNQFNQYYNNMNGMNSMNHINYPQQQTQFNFKQNDVTQPSQIGNFNDSNLPHPQSQVNMNVPNPYQQMPMNYNGLSNQLSDQTAYMNGFSQQNNSLNNQNTSKSFKTKFI